MIKKILLLAALTAGAVSLAACQTDASTASLNLSRAADMFEIQRRVVFYNGITGEYMLSMEGKCSIEDDTNQLEVVCKHGPNDFRKHFLGLSDNISYFAEQLEGVKVSVYHTRIIWKPQSIIPDIDIRGDLGALVDTVVE